MTRSLSGARARQLRRRAHRASLHNVKGAPPPSVVDESAAATRQQLHDARATLGRLTTLTGRSKERIERLERRLGKQA